ncbi:cytosolic sulfotransferase 15-like [Salvia hispanica]|uniref:cytosolic sulfotransferase 15-like n=1 Tax=Salvia hispanica TaxID=49212 RepID=UPI0020098512|nr:cytosolic sulfotransferase 15-like [Salvia hispanica]
MDLSSLPREKWVGDDYLVQLGGFWFLPQFVKKNKRVINNYNPLPNDVILVTFPKSGTTWLKSLLYSILNRSSRHKLAVEHPHDLVPFLEAQVFAEADEPPALAAPLDGPRLFATHLPYQLLTKTLDSSQCKVIYLTRNPKDLLVSFWHFVNKWNMEKPNQSWPLDEATDKFCDGVIPCGPYYDHVLGYRELSLKRPKNVMFVNFEGMLEDPHGYVKKLGDFLECPFEEEEEVDDIVKNCSFEMLSSYDVNKSKESTTWFPTPYNSFFRKGKVGDYKNYLSNESVQRIDTLTKERFHSLGFMYGI